ncbi:hypothetical protein JCM6882_000644 [Rhodosporidiobolus microsporus]
MASLDNFFDMAYSNKLELGAGLQILSGKMAPASPFKPGSLVLPPVTTVARHAEFTFTKLRTTRDVEKVVNNRVKARAPVKGLPVAVTATYLREVKVSDTEMVTLIDTTYDTLPQIVPANTAQFTKEAEEILAADPHKFAERYGDYFIAGYSCRAHLTAMATHRATDKEEMNKFAFKVQAGLDETGVKDGEAVVDEKKANPVAAGEAPAAEGPKSAEEVAKDAKETGVKDLLHSVISKIGATVTNTFSKKTRDLQVETTIQIDYSGVQGVLGAINLDQFAALLDQFKSNIAPVPLIAHIKSYKSIDARCLSPQENLLPQVSEKLTSGFTQVYALQNVALSSIYPEVVEHKDSLSTLIDELSTIDPASQEDINAWTARLEAEKTDINKELARREFMKDVLSTYDVPHWKFKEGQMFKSKASGFEKHQVGLYSDMFDQVLTKPSLQFIRNEIVMEQEELRYDDRLIPSHPVIRLPNNSGFVIGFEITNDRDDGHSGEAYLKQANRDGVSVEFHPDSLRDSYWTVRVWTVDRKRYRTN